MKRLSGLDAYLLYSETSAVPTHTIKIALIDTRDCRGQFTFDRFRRVVERKLPELEPLRYQLVDIPLKLHHPMWMEGCEVDLDVHLRQVTVSSPGGRREFDDLVARIAQEPLDRSRPLWEMHFVEGLADHKMAVIVKVHHALADGVASANLLAQAIYGAVSAPNHNDAAACTPPVPAELLRAAGRDHLRHLTQLPSVIKDTATGLARVRRRTRERRQHPELARLFSAPKTFINHRVSPVRRFATATLSLDQAKETSKKCGVSLNDLVLAISTGALRDLVLAHHGGADDPMIASVPVSSDPSAKRISGNAFGNLLVSLPVQIDDPLQRIQVVTLATSIAKENNNLRGPELMGRWFEYVPPALAPPAFRWFGRREAHNKMYNVSISNVPGPRQRGSIGGVPISEFYSVGPLTQACGMNITVWSYVDQLNIGVLTDDRTLDDAHEFTDSMIGEFAEIRRAVGLSQELARIEAAMPQAVPRSGIRAAPQTQTS